MQFTHHSYTLGLFVGLALGVGCSNLLTNHCANISGDLTCAERGAGAFCSSCIAEADGCTDVMPAEDCYFPGLGEESDASTVVATNGGMTDEETALEPSSASGVTTGPLPCVSDQECLNAWAPFCGANGECVACDETEDPDGACVGLDPGVPVCLGGKCVECTAAAPDACGGDTPVCDDATNACVCTEHEQCGEAACNFYERRCLSEDSVVHVGPNQKFADLGEAVASFGRAEEGTIVVHQNNYTDSVLVDGGRVLAFLAAEGDLPAWDNESSPQLSVIDDGTAFLDGLQLSSNDVQPAIMVSDGRVWVDRSIVNNDGGGVLATNADDLTLRNSELSGNKNQPALVIDGGQARVERSTIVRNDDGGVLVLNKADLTLSNSFVGDDKDDMNAMEVIDASATIVYSTLAAWKNNTAALSCSASSAVVVRNSLLVAQGDSTAGALDVACDQADITSTATESTVPGMDNVSVGEMIDPAVWFVDYANGDLRLVNNGPTVFADIAHWQLGDPLTDIDGGLRPGVEGATDYAGADVPGM